MVCITSLLDDNGIFQFSVAIEVGNRIIFTSGPLQDNKEEVIKVDKRKQRPRIKVNFLGNEHYAD